MKIKFLMLLCTALSFFSYTFAQTTNVRVESVFNLGSYDFAYVYDISTGEYYKTAAYSTGQLVIESIQTMHYLDYTQNFDGKILNPEGDIYLELLQTESFSMPINNNYGMPSLINGILFFQNQEHIEEFYEILWEFSNSQYEESEDLLQVFENEFPGFISLTDYFNEKYALNTGTTPTQLLNYSREDIVRDPVEKSIYNPQIQVGIGDSIYMPYKYWSGGETLFELRMVRYHKNDQQVLNILSKYDREVALNMISTFQSVDYMKGINILSQKATFTDTINVGNTTFDLDYNSQIDYANSSVNCDVFGKTITWDLTRTVDSSVLDQLWPSFNIDSLLVDFGDGTTELLQDQGYSTMDFISGDPTIDPEVQRRLEFPHTYSDTGVFVVKIYATNITWERTPDFIYSFELVDSMEVKVGGSCSNLNKYPDPHTYHVDPTIKYELEYWMKDAGVFTPKQKNGAKLTNWQHDDNGKMVKRKADELSLSVHAKYRDDKCEYLSENVAPQKKRKGRKSIKRCVKIPRQEDGPSWYRNNNDTKFYIYWSDYGLSESEVIYFIVCP